MALAALASLALSLSAPPLSTVVIEGVPHVLQKPDFCGEACVAMWLGKLGRAGDQDWVFDQAGVDPLLGRGAWSRELVTALSRTGFRPGTGWYTVRSDHPADLDDRFRELHADLVRGIPSIVCMHYDGSAGAPEHFRLVLGYDARADEVIFHDPAERGAAYRRMPRATFLALWPLKYSTASWTVIRFRLEGPGSDGEVARRPTPADYAQHVMALEKTLPRGFAIRIAPPFVVIGDGGASAVDRAARGTVAWAVEKLKGSFFAEDPDEIIDVWLFQDDRSYRTHAKALFGEEPDTPYGYYSAAHHALVMNIATGGGTLVHEIVHPYVRADFPGAPPWLNEGLGSLFEQAGEKDGRIVGFTNWRLAGLQQAIRRGALPPFAELLAAGETEFYSGKHSDTAYGQARYLMYWLQENGKLRDFYGRFRTARVKDPTGLATLEGVLGEKDLGAFQKRWEKWVLGLRFGD
jgi:hypothetical protein